MIGEAILISDNGGLFVVAGGRLTLEGLILTGRGRPQGSLVTVTSGSLVALWCIFKDNTVLGNGAGINTTAASAVIIADSIFEGLQAQGDGGAIFAQESAVMMSNTTIITSQVSLCRLHRWTTMHPLHPVADAKGSWVAGVST